MISPRKRLLQEQWLPFCVLLLTVFALQTVSYASGEDDATNSLSSQSITPHDDDLQNWLDQQEGGAETVEVIFLLSLVVIIWIYKAFCLHQIANRLNDPRGWYAWIPILNLYLMCSLVRMSWWCIFLFFLPIANWIVSALVWVRISAFRGKSPFLGLLILLPVVNLGLMAYLAVSE